MWLVDPKTKESSVTLTLFVIGFAVAITKLALSGVALGTFQLQQFSGVDFAAVCGALGGIYAIRKNTDSKSE